MMSISPQGARERVCGCLFAFGLLGGLVLSGCHHEPAPKVKSVATPPTVRVIHPQERNIVRVIGQPSFVESYERTSIFPKVVGYIDEWIVDIGDVVKEGDVLATIFAPELVEDYRTKKATVVLDKERIDLAEQVVKVAAADVKAAEARLAEAKAIVGKYQSEVDRWDMEVKRLKRETDRGVVDPQILLESTNQWKSSVAARDAADATVAKSDAELLSRKEALAEAKVRVQVAQADLDVAKSDASYAKAWVDYLTLTAPYNGVVMARNANTGDFVTPQYGDPTAMTRAPHLSPENAAPIYVVMRTDVVRIFVDIPEQDADYVNVGTKASVLIEAYSEDPIPGIVTRTSWALNVKSRTLRAEIDLPNRGARILPGMYAYAEVTIERHGAKALPKSALTHKANKTFYWTYENGEARKTEVQTGVADDEWVEVTKRRPAGTHPAQMVKARWSRISGSEEVIVGDLSTLTEGTRVHAVPAGGEGRAATAKTGRDSANPPVSRSHSE
jgi:RND family efflux transporter MFP subunit